MQNLTPPQAGQMILYDDILPPLVDNTYRLTVETDVTVDGNPVSPALPTKQSFFSIEGPRFTMAPTEVASVYPPRNGHGSFSDAVPHIALTRRTLPWERELDRANKIPAPTVNPGDAPPPGAPPPWLALLVFEEGDNFTLLQGVPLEGVVGRDIFADLGSPQNITCDAVQTDTQTLAALLPSKEELTLLAHVRSVNVNDKELNVGGGDGFFAVVMSNRLPSPNAKCCACLVSLEARSDIVAANPPTTLGAAVREHAAMPVNIVGGDFTAVPILYPVLYFNQSVQLVLLYSWKFSSIGPGTFRDLMQGLGVAMIGTVENPGHPPLTDTCHLPVDLQDRAGVPEKVLYRGPLTPFQLTRDPLGPYHSADQARRATVETGAEDISYAAAFEVGRLIAAADKSLAAALMQWRREAYRQSARADTVARAQGVLNLGTIDLHAPVTPVLAAGAATLAAQGAGPIADPYGLAQLQGVVGLNPTAVQQAFNLDSPQRAIALLGGDAGATGAVVPPIQQTTRNNTTIDQLAVDTNALGLLDQARGQLLANTIVKLGLPVLIGISPSSGPTIGGTTVTVSGAHFTGVTGVSFGPNPVKFQPVSDTQIVAVSPEVGMPVLPATVDVSVTTQAGTSATSAADQFTFLPLPVVTAVSPNVGTQAGGTAVTITGSGFTQVTGVSFGPTAAASFSFVSDTTVTAVSPAGSGTQDITVTTAAGTSATSAADQFTYAVPPTVINLDPNNGNMNGNANVVIVGSGFTGATAVNFGASPALRFEVVSDREIVAVYPGWPGGAPVAYVTVTTPGGTSADTPGCQFSWNLAF
jgi:IPT/TIG domain